MAVRIFRDNVVLSLVIAGHVPLGASSPSENGSTDSTDSTDSCDRSWCSDLGSDCQAGLDWEFCTCTNGRARVLNTLVHPAGSKNFTCCTSGTTQGEECGSFSWKGVRELAYRSAVLGVFGIAGVTFITTWLCCGYHQQERSETLSASDRAIVDSPQVRDGAALHRQVFPSRWCVTRDDLLQFRRLVKNAVQEGRITPTQWDAFDPADDRIGPCIHTVNAQFIMPVTAAAGNVSWALMMHPEGLECDLFVTHGWQEGVYEFIDKVVNSWPSGKKHAYCCMLSNPQNLDISDMIVSPRESPFALALSAASHMMVVPNQKGSIYARVWCCYEAFIAYEGKKLIVKALNSLPGFWLKVLRALFIYIIGAAGGDFLCFVMVQKQRLDFLPVIGLVMLIQLPLALAYMCLRKQPHYRTFHLVLICSSLNLGFASAFATTFIGIRIRSVWLLYVGFFLLSGSLEADRLLQAECISEANELQIGYTGRVADASSSAEQDKLRIIGEINSSGAEDALDKAVAVLIKTGISSPILRAAAERAGDLGDATAVSLSAVIGIVCFWGTIPIVILELDDCSSTSWVLWLGSVEAFLWVFIFLVTTVDCRAFAANVLSWYIIALPLFLADFITSKYVCRFQMYVSCFWGPLILVTSLAGPAYVARVPVLGPAVVWLSFADGLDIMSLCSGGGNTDSVRLLGKGPGEPPPRPS